MNKKIGILVLIVIFGFACAEKLFGDDGDIFVKEPSHRGLGSLAEYEPGEIIVKFKSGVNIGKKADFHKSKGCSLISTAKFADCDRIKIPAGKTVKDMVDIYRKNPDVEYAEPNFIAQAFLVPNDPYYRFQWHLDDTAVSGANPYGGANGGGINLEPAWDINTGMSATGVRTIVAVIDTGVAYENFGRKFKKAPDLANTSFVQGYDFVNNDLHPNDDNGHGTHVTGTIAQSTNNLLGVSGVAFKSSIMPVKVLNQSGSGTYLNIADGIYFAANAGAKVINLSLGGTGPSITLENALAYAYNAGVTIVAAAGNEFQNGNPPVYPAAYDAYVIAVGATRYDETRSYYSNTGAYVDLTAPGGDLTVDQNFDGYGDGVLQQTFNNDPRRFAYWFFQGTSMASPHAAGVAALVIANGITGPNNVRAALESTAEDKGQAGRDDEYGWGIVDALASLKYTIAP